MPEMRRAGRVIASASRHDLAPRIPPCWITLSRTVQIRAVLNRASLDPVALRCVALRCAGPRCFGSLRAGSYRAALDRAALCSIEPRKFAACRIVPRCAGSRRVGSSCITPHSIPLCWIEQVHAALVRSVLVRVVLDPVVPGRTAQWIAPCWIVSRRVALCGTMLYRFALHYGALRWPDRAALCRIGLRCAGSRCAGSRRAGLRCAGSCWIKPRRFALC